MGRCCSLLLLSVLLTSPLVLPAAQSPASKLQILIVEGDGAINNIRQRVAREPVVQVVDENNKPVAGATVVFMLPDVGPSGGFLGGEKMLTVMTDETGRATARGMQANALEGDYSIRVTASYQGLTASTTIAMSNVAAAGAGISAGAVALILGAVAGAAVGIAVGLTGGDNGGTVAPPQVQRPTATIGTPGTPGFSPVGSP